MQNTSDNSLKESNIDLTRLSFDNESLVCKALKNQQLFTADQSGIAKVWKTKLKRNSPIHSLGKQYGKQTKVN